VVGHGQHGVAHCDDRLLSAAGAGDAPVAGAEEAVGANDAGGDVAEGAGQPGLPLGLLLFLGAGVR
jgi:hypothetical protein